MFLQSRTSVFSPRSIRRLTAWAAFALLGVALAVSPAMAQSPVTAKPQGYVNDFAGVLSPSARAQLTALCTEVDQKTQAQIAVVTVPSLDGKPIQDYAIDLATKWGVGPKQSNRGIMILLAVNDHKYWTLVGYGLEPILPDGKVGGFGREAVPLLRQNNFDLALFLMTRRVADVIAQDKGVTLSGRPLLTPSRSSTRSSNPFSAFIWIFFLVVWLITSAFRWLVPGPRRRGGGWGMGPPYIGGMGGGGFGGGGGGGGGGGFGGFGGGSFGGGGAGGSW